MSIKLSYSAASRFRQCPQKYYHSLKYYSKDKSAALPFGSAIEEGVTTLIQTRDLTKACRVFELYWSNEKNTTRFPVFDNPEYSYSTSDFDLELLRYADVAVTDDFISLGFSEQFESWQAALEAMLPLYYAQDSTFFNHENSVKFVIRSFWRSCFERGKIMLRTCAEQILPEIEDVVLVDSEPGIQVPITIENQSGDQIVGYVDYVLKLKNFDVPVVVDCKTAARPYTEHEILTSEQLRTYVHVLQDKLGPCKAAYMVLGKKIKYKKKCNTCQLEYSSQSKKCKTCKENLTKTPYSTSQLLVTGYSEQYLDSLLDDYDNILNSIVQGTNFKNTQSCHLYNRPCEFYDMCWKNKSPEELAHLAKKKGT